jgi:pentatricopeptide repeat protein
MQVLTVLKQGKQRGVALNKFIYSAALSALGRSGMWQEAIVLLKAVRGEGADADRAVYNAAIAACSTCGHWAEAVNLLSAMWDAGIYFKCFSCIGV